MQSQALSNLRVLELGQFVSAAYCTKLMADLGAEVIKIERPGLGDVARRCSPFANDDPDTEKSGLFLYLNTNKLGVTLNLESSRGKKIFKELIQDVDILVENNSPGWMKGHGLDYESLSSINPQLIMTSITPFGQTGPYRDYKAYNINLVHGGGLGYLTTIVYPSHLYPRECQGVPYTLGGRQAHLMAALNAAVASMSAIYYRQFAGEGQYIDISEHECIASALEMTIPYWTHQNEILQGERAVLLAPVSLLPTKDGYVFLMCLEEHQWEKLVKLMGEPEWARQEIFKDRWARGQYWDALELLLTDWFTQYTTEEIYKMGQAARIPVVPASTIKDLVESPHLNWRNFFVEIDHQMAGQHKYPGAPYKFAAAGWTAKRPAPMLGEHNQEIYCQRLGYSKADLLKLKAAGVV